MRCSKKTIRRGNLHLSIASGEPSCRRAETGSFLGCWQASPSGRPKVAARGIWGSRDRRSDTLHNRHHGEDREMSGDPGAIGALSSGRSALPRAMANASPAAPSPLLFLCWPVDIFHKIRKFDWYRTAMLISPATCRQFDKVCVVIVAVCCRRRPCPPLPSSCAISRVRVQYRWAAGATRYTSR